jgi:hypothetical protein
MAPLTYGRLIKGLHSLREKADTELSGTTFSHHHKQISRAINDGIASAESGLARDPGALFPGQIKHWIGERVDEILEGVVPPTATRPAVLKASTADNRIIRSTAATGVGIQKRYNTRARSSASARGALSTLSITRADLECATTLLNAGTSKPSYMPSSRIPVFTREEVECAMVLLQLVLKPVVFAKQAPVPAVPASKDFWTVIA